MTEPKYQIGDKIKNRNGHSGNIFRIYFNEVSKEWVYFISDKKGLIQAAIKESNIV